MRKLDVKDLEILGLIQENSKLTSQQISKRTRIPITTVHNRIKKLEEEKIIKQYSVQIDKRKIGKMISAYILVSVNYPQQHIKRFSQEEIARKIRQIDGVSEVAIVAGETDIILKIDLDDINSLNDFVVNKLRNIDGIDKTRTMVILHEF
ncbi:MAG: AsnC family transcriptional regulator [archaeon GW2011_AR3]|nr:MAG: AsnC family transcriptional regulator [archaeon GW2011_AR3]MBS3109295.1 Lrp/AsnC family transcriptional regulator [Candidatus Woesearchaeota archaeon]